ncbi:MAG: hypothetical protein AAGB00_00190 [Planctomycetota bacterium]
MIVRPASAPLLIACLLLWCLLLAATGCLTKQYNWDIDRLRDPRAADLDKRLTAQPPAVANPFATGDEAPSE